MVVVLFSSCTALQKIAPAAGKPATMNAARSSEEPSSLRFLDIDMPVEKTGVKNQASSASAKKVSGPAASSYKYVSGIPSVESASMLQLKYALLLNTEVEEVRNTRMYEFIDDWYGTRYCMGGSSKSCIDCSAFVQTFFAALYAVSVPRTAREQYKASKRISTTELQEGDLLFFNTRGGISHVGIYLQNNKFVHASTSGGVMISDMFEPYWVKHLINAGRLDKGALAKSE